MMKAQKLNVILILTAVFVFFLGFGTGWAIQGLRVSSGAVPEPDSVSESASETEAVPETETEPDLWAGFMNQAGFFSNEEAYGMARSQWHERFGEPDMSQSTYYKDFVSDIYYYYAPDGSWGRVLELNFDADVINSDPKPSSIRMTDLNSEPLSGPDDLESVFSGGTLGVTKEFAGKTLDEVSAVLGQPLVSLPDPWGYATWQIEDGELMLHLDEDSRVLCADVKSAWNDIVGEDDDAASEQELNSESTESLE